jgi:hypothetical protein
MTSEIRYYSKNIINNDQDIPETTDYTIKYISCHGIITPGTFVIPKHINIITLVDVGKTLFINPHINKLIEKHIQMYPLFNERNGRTKKCLELERLLDNIFINIYRKQFDLYARNKGCKPELPPFICIRNHPPKSTMNYTTLVFKQKSIDKNPDPCDLGWCFVKAFNPKYNPHESDPSKIETKPFYLKWLLNDGSRKKLNDFTLTDLLNKEGRGTYVLVTCRNFSTQCTPEIRKLARTVSFDTDTKEGEIFTADSSYSKFLLEYFQKREAYRRSNRMRDDEVDDEIAAEDALEEYEVQDGIIPVPNIYDVGKDSEIISAIEAINVYGTCNTDDTSELCKGERERDGGRDGGRDGWRERERDGGRDGWRDGGRERERDGGRERDHVRDGGRDHVRDGGRDRDRDYRDVGRDRDYRDVGRDRDYRDVGRDRDYRDVGRDGGRNGSRDREYRDGARDREHEYERGHGHKRDGGSSGSGGHGSGSSGSGGHGSGSSGSGGHGSGSSGRPLYNFHKLYDSQIVKLENNFYEKYLKYKTKYFNLKGGERIKTYSILDLSEYQTPETQNFAIKYIKSHGKIVADEERREFVLPENVNVITLSDLDTSIILPSRLDELIKFYANNYVLFDTTNTKTAECNELEQILQYEINNIEKSLVCTLRTKINIRNHLQNTRINNIELIFERSPERAPDTDLCDDINTCSIDIFKFKRPSDDLVRVDKINNMMLDWDFNSITELREREARSVPKKTPDEIKAMYPKPVLKRYLLSDLIKKEGEGTYILATCRVIDSRCPTYTAGIMRQISAESDRRIGGIPVSGGAGSGTSASVLSISTRTPPSVPVSGGAGSGTSASIPVSGGVGTLGGIPVSGTGTPNSVPVFYGPPEPPKKKYY